ncbi:MAG: hypothetical protein ACYC6L_02375 [Anaerolineae bacterium]
MLRRTLVKSMIASVVALGLPISISGQSPDQAPTPVPSPAPQAPGLPDSILKRKVLVADREAAAKRAREAGLQPGVASQPAGASIQAFTPMTDIHYFGPYPNYANSPMPVGPITSLVVDAGGAGYTTPVAVISDVYGTGTGATADVIASGGVVTGFTITNAGTGYSAPVVTISDAAVPPTGSGALASAFIGGVPGSLTGGIRKFMDSLPGLGPLAANNLGNFISQAVPDTTTYPGSDYYEIEVGEYMWQFHTDLPPTKVRGYKQLNGGDGLFHYMGPVILARKDVPVRVKLFNHLPTGTAGNLFIPVDKTVMGAGMGPAPMTGMPGMYEDYPQTRTAVHLHGGDTAWISDGTPHQWITPAGEVDSMGMPTPYPQGASLVNVPDMPLPTVGDGTTTFYWNNGQSARLLFYHDHAWGITRLNVYVGMAAGYLISDAVEDDLINATNNTGVNPGLVKVLPDLGIPLVLQDKTFVDPATIPAQDPTWRWNYDPISGGPTLGSLWVPHVYVPAQNPWDPTGSNPFGRWQYGPWFWPPTGNIDFPPIPNPFYDPLNNPWEPPMTIQSPDPSMGMEAFNDTTLVNGQVYPYLDVDPKVYRFRILNAADDRFFNLHFYVADPTVVTTDGRVNTEVRMVPALANPSFPPTWPSDARAGGVPDPAMRGPSWIQIGSEGGFLPAPVVIPPQPIAWNMNPLAFNVGNVTDHSLLLGCAERADVLVDFTNYAGKTLIMYNDAPAAFPALDPRYDYYTGSPDLTSTGGVPPIQAGFGPATRTIMQVRVRGAADGTGNSVDSIAVINPGVDYNYAPTVDISGGNGTGATASCTCKIDHINVLTPGSGYTTASVQDAGAVVYGTATILNGQIATVTVTNPGTGFTTPPVLNVVGDGTGATLEVTLKIEAVTVLTEGSGYTTAPAITFLGGGGYGASANAVLTATGVPYDLATLNTIWAKDISVDPPKPSVFELTQNPPLIPQAAYNSALGTTYLNNASQWVQLQDFTYTWTQGPAAGLTLPIQPKAAHDEMGAVYDLQYGRMGGQFGLELPVTTSVTQNVILYPFVTPPINVIRTSDLATPIGSLNDGTQIWKFTHNGVDSHPVHVHLFNAQVVNRVAWDGALLPPDANELGWKDTFRMNPLEHLIIALRPTLPVTPFRVQNSVRYIDPSSPPGVQLRGGPLGYQDPTGVTVTVVNHKVNFGAEYMTHCHILSHEEMDMMQAMLIAEPPYTPAAPTVVVTKRSATITWTDVQNATSYTLQRATSTAGPWISFVGILPTVVGGTVTYTDLKLKSGTYYYRVIAFNAVGDTAAYTGSVGFPTITLQSPPSEISAPATVL